MVQPKRAINLAHIAFPPSIVRGGVIAALGYSEENANPVRCTLDGVIMAHPTTPCPQDFARLHFGSQWSLTGVQDVPAAPRSPQLPPRITPRRPTHDEPLVFRGALVGESGAPLIQCSSCRTSTPALSTYVGEAEQDLGFKEVRK